MINTDNNDIFGINDYHFYSKSKVKQESFQEILRASCSASQNFYGAGTIIRPGTSSIRPVTAVRGAGYTSTVRQEFDPLKVSSGILSFSKEINKDNSPEHKIKQIERKIMHLIEESAKAACNKNVKLALEKAREASSRERALIRLQEQLGLSESHNIDLTFAVIFNLACQYTNNELYTEAVATYHAITRNKNFSNSARLKMNIGNIYVKMGQLSQAVKMYQMALDQTTTSQKCLRIKIMHNIGILFVQMGRLEEAANSFEWVMKEKPDLKAGIHAVLCHFALMHEDKMRKGFLELLDVPLYVEHDDKYSLSTDDAAANFLNETVSEDSLSKLEYGLKSNAEKTLLIAANLIAPVIEETLARGFAWCLDAIKSSTYSSLASNLEINKAMVFLYNKEVRMAIDSLKIFDNRSARISSSASSILSFIYFLRGEYDLAEKYSNSAKDTDNNNIAAYINLSACYIMKNDLDSAKKYLESALQNNANQIYALYNLGLIYKSNCMFEKALECFWKIKRIAEYDPLTLYQIGHIYQLNSEFEHSIQWYNQLLSLIPSDPGVLQKLGEMFDTMGDKQQAYQYYSDSYRFYPASFGVIDWLGSYFVSMQVTEKALKYFQSAVNLAPDQPKWRLLKAACLRKTGQFHKALIEYQDIHQTFPENIECLRLLVRLSSDLGLKESQLYLIRLRNLEKNKSSKEKFDHGSAETTNLTTVDLKKISLRKPTGKKDSEFSDEELGVDLLPE